MRWAFNWSLWRPDRVPFSQPEDALSSIANWSACTSTRITCVRMRSPSGDAESFRCSRTACPTIASTSAAGARREAFLKRGLCRPLQVRADGRAHSGRTRGERDHARQRFGLAIDVVEEIEAGRALPAIIGDEAQRGLARLIRHILRDRPILLHPAQDIGDTLLRPLGMPVRAVIIRPFGQPCERYGFGERQLRGRLAEITARGKLDPDKARESRPC